jgi:hypothetical protein
MDIQLIRKFFLLSTYKIWKVLISLAKKIIIYCFFHVLGLFIPKMSLERKNFRLSRGIAVRSLVEICIDDISAVLRATDFRFGLHFVSWAELMHLILRILKSLEQIQESKFNLKK